MHLLVELIADTHTSTLSKLSIDGQFFGFVLEDGHRENKIPGETRIPGGIYPIRARKEGKFYTRYKKLWGHEFVPELIGVPGFQYILIHPGNVPADTRGCLLVGRKCGFVQNFYVDESRAAYCQLQPAIAAAFKRGEAVTITINR